MHPHRQQEQVKAVEAIPAGAFSASDLPRFGLQVEPLVGRLGVCGPQAADGADIVSAQFIRAQWLSQFGFQSHLRYAGVVFPLGELQEASATPDAPEQP